MDVLSHIVKAFNDQFGGLFADAKRMEERITGEIPKKVAEDPAFQNDKKNSDRQNARIEHDKALKRVITALFIARSGCAHHFALSVLHAPAWSAQGQPRPAHSRLRHSQRFRPWPWLPRWLFIQ